MEVLKKGLDGIERVVKNAREIRSPRSPDSHVVFRHSNLTGTKEADEAVDDELSTSPTKF